MNYIVLNDKRYDILLPEEHNCDKYETCKNCPLEDKGCQNIIDFIDDTLGVVSESDVIVINHEE